MTGPLRSLLEQSYDHFRRCGAGRRECVVVWTGPLEKADLVDEVVHPLHRSDWDGYELDVGWLKSFWVELYERAQTVRLQVHTHPHEAFHSSIDDEFSFSQRTGFLSLVLPNFAAGGVTLEGAALFELGDRGWRELDPLERLADAA